jgi:Tfp pilus assembly protein PilN
MQSVLKPFNLAETKIVERNECRREVNRRLRVVGFLVAISLLVAVASFACKLTISASATRLRSELGDVQQRCIRAKQEMSGLKLQSGQRDWQKGLTEESKRWLRVLGEVLDRLPPDAWISRIENSPQSSTLSLEGAAPSYESVSAYINRLRASRDAVEVRLTNSKVTVGANDTFVEFSLTVKLKASQAQPAQPVQPAGVPPVQGST